MLKEKTYAIQVMFGSRVNGCKSKWNYALKQDKIVYV